MGRIKGLHSAVYYVNYDNKLFENINKVHLENDIKKYLRENIGEKYKDYKDVWIKLRNKIYRS